jgi:hypothetical protein
MYSHPFLHPREKHRVHRPAAKARPARRELPKLPEAMPRRRTLDEKLDQALELTFPASDAFVIV